MHGLAINPVGGVLTDHDAITRIGLANLPEEAKKTLVGHHLIECT